MTRSRLDRPLRIVQTNLQVRDTDAIDPERLAAQIVELHGNTLVFNAGGIYAWYDTDVPFHTKNPHLPDEDLFGSVLEACHDRDVAFVARVDFSKADDTVYGHRPEWFARDPDGSTRTIGAERPGGWPILRHTCTNGAYRKEAVALPVLSELVSRYDVDGVFYNAPNYVRCHCDTCRRKYEAMYGEELPDDPAEFRADWPERCVRDNMRERYSLLAEEAPGVEMILYYHSDGSNLKSRAETTDMLCTESQNVLSRGHADLPGRWKPARTMRVANALPDGPPAIGIIHACPGMDWRHVGLPPAEHEYWTSQIPANGGHVWHTLTGVPDTIVDDRLLRVVERVNAKIERLESHAEGAKSAARTALCWDASPAARGLFDGLIHRQVPFDLLLESPSPAERLTDYDLIVVPHGWDYDEAFVEALDRHADAGGRVLIEGGLPDGPEALFSLLGLAGPTYESDDLVASYLRFEEEVEEAGTLRRGLERTDLVPHRGLTARCEPDEDAAVPLSLVPQWSPLEAVGAPPERASLHVSRTEVPGAVVRGDGRTLYLPFALSGLLADYRLDAHHRVLENAVDLLLGDRRLVRTAARQGLQVVPYETDEGYLVHLINGTGARPLSTAAPLSDVEVELRIGSEAEVEGVRTAFTGEELAVSRDGDRVTFAVPEVDAWEAVRVRCDR